MWIAANIYSYVAGGLCPFAEAAPFGRMNTAYSEGNHMNHKSCKFKRITALLLMLLMLLPGAPALAESYSAAVTDDVAAYADASFTRKVGDL